MRILSNSQREQILAYISHSFANKSINPFLFDTTYAIIASGEEEATFDWLGVNYIFNTLEQRDDDADRDSLGALDLGGQSTQIAFAPNPQSNILAAFTAVRLYEITHRLYTHSYLQYGTNAIEQRIAQLSYNEYTQNGITSNPCLNTGASVNYTVNAMNGTQKLNVLQVGSSNMNPFECRKLMRKLMVNDSTCYVHDCSFNGVYMAQIPDNMTFIAFSAFGYAMNGLNLSQNIDLGVFYENVTVNICNMTWQQLQNSEYNMQSSVRFLNTYCRLNTYIYTLLHEGYGFPLIDTPIIFTNEYNGNAITWTQGSILRDSNWLPYDVQYSVNDELNSEGKMWRALGITLASLLIIVVIGLVVVVRKMRKQSNGYNSMTHE